jgi:hypothetical protein
MDSASLCCRLPLCECCVWVSCSAAGVGHVPRVRPGSWVGGSELLGRSNSSRQCQMVWASLGCQLHTCESYGGFLASSLGVVLGLPAKVAGQQRLVGQQQTASCTARCCRSRIRLAASKTLRHGGFTITCATCASSSTKTTTCWCTSSRPQSLVCFIYS